LSIGRTFTTGVKGHPNAHMALQSTQPIRRNGNIYCAVKIAIRPTSRGHLVTAPPPASDGGFDFAIDADRPRQSLKDPYSHSIINGTSNQLSYIEVFSATSIFTVRFTVNLI